MRRALPLALPLLLLLAGCSSETNMDTLQDALMAHGACDGYLEEPDEVVPMFSSPQEIKQCPSGTHLLITDDPFSDLDRLRIMSEAIGMHKLPVAYGENWIILPATEDLEATRKAAETLNGTSTKL